MKIKKKPAVSKLLTGQNIIGLNSGKKKKKLSKYAEGALFADIESKMMNALPKLYGHGGGHGDIAFDEEVTQGSARHNELLANKNKRGYFLAQQKSFADKGVTPKEISISKMFGIGDFDEDALPPNSEVAYEFDKGQDVLSLSDPSKGLQIFSSPSTGKEFITGMADPGVNPDFDLDFGNDIDMTLQEEAGYTAEKKVPELLTSQAKIQQDPNAFYKDASGNSTQMSKGAKWNESRGVYYDPETGTTYDPRAGTSTTESKAQYDPETGDVSFEQGGEFFKALGGILRETFQQGGKKKTTAELLPGELITELEPNKNVAANAEVEHGEYVKFPDGTVQSAFGEKHKDGGIDMLIPDGTKILSAKRMLTKDQVKTLNDDFDIKVTTKNSYAQAIDKYVDKIGLTKLYDEQEDLFKTLQESMKTDSEGTDRINKEYLSKKIHQIELQKEEKEKLKGGLFDQVFTMQEVGKRGEEKEEVEQFFAEGGISRESFQKVVNKYGLSEREGIELYKGNLPTRLMEGGKKESYGHGGEKGDEPKTVEEAQEMYAQGLISRAEADRYEVELAGIAAAGPVKFQTTSGDHEFSNQDQYARETQKSAEGAFGKITKENLPQVLNNLYQNFPDIVAEEYGVVYNDDGTIEFDKDIDFGSVSKKVENFQKRAQKRMEDTANMVLANPDSFSPEYVTSAQGYLDNETFDGTLARGIDSKQGQFTSGRFSLGINVVTPEEQQMLQSQGIFTTKQLQDAVDKGDVELSKPSLERLEGIRTLTPEGTDPDFAINSLVPETPAAPAEEIVTAPEKIAPDPTLGLVDDIVVPGKQYPKIFATPDQTPLPPSAMDAHLMGNVRLERIDPIRIGVETELQQTSDAIKLGTESLDNLPPNQRAAAIVALQANAQKGINDAIHKTNVVNASNAASAELFNIGQSGKESQLKLGNLLSFEQRQLTAKAKTQEEVRNYYDQLNRIKVNNFRNQQDMNLINTLAPDYTLSTDGRAIDFTPEGDFELQDRSKFKGLFG